MAGLLTRVKYGLRDIYPEASSQWELVLYVMADLRHLVAEEVPCHDFDELIRESRLIYQAERRFQDIPRG